MEQRDIRPLSPSLRGGAAVIGLWELIRIPLELGASIVEHNALAEHDPLLELEDTLPTLYFPHPQEYFAQVDDNRFAGFTADREEINSLLRVWLQTDRRVQDWSLAGRRNWYSEVSRSLNEGALLPEQVFGDLISSTSAEVQNRLGSFAWDQH